MKPLDPHSLRRELSAFVDGELDAAGTDRLLRHLASDPSAADALRLLQELNAQARRAVRGRTPPPTDALRERLRQLTGAEPPAAGSTPPSPSRSRTLRAFRGLLPRAAAAIVLMAIGVWVGRSSSRPDPAAPVSGRGATAADVLPAVVVAQAEEVHGFCSRLAEGLHTAGYPADVAALATSVERDLRGERPYPDLLPIGYRYRGAGPCGVPLGDTIHLLYRSVQPGSVKAVSVFVQPSRGQFPLDEGRLYTVSVATSPFPMLAWRTDRVVYFLLADDASTVRRAAALIRGEPATAPSAGPTAP